MKKLPMLMMALFLLSSIASLTSRSMENREMAIELPDGRIFWYSGYGDYKNLTVEMCERYNLSHDIHKNFSVIDGYYLRPYHWDDGWKGGEEGNIIAWSDGYPRSTPDNRYPRFSAYSQVSHYAPGNDEIWNHSIGNGLFGSIDSMVVGFGNRIFFNSWNGFYCFDMDGNLLWKNESIKGMGSPYIYNSTIFVGSSDGYLYSLTVDGELLWKRKICISPGYVGITTSPVVINNTVYIGGYESDNHTSYFYAMGINGTELWKVPLNSTVYHGVPSCHDGEFFIPLAGRYNGTEERWYPDYGVMAVKNGKIEWILRTNNSVKSTPLVYNNSIYFTSVNGYLYRAGMDGKMVWRVKIGYSTSSPNGWHNTIFVGSGSFGGGGKIYAISENSSIIWNRSVRGGVQSAITISPPFIYFSLNSQNGGVMCYNFKGEEIWNFTTGTYVMCSPTIISEFLLFGDDSGKIHLLRDSTEPVISFYGGNFYSYGDDVKLFIEARDNMGVRYLKVHYHNSDIVGVDNVTIVFHANFTGEMTILAYAEDYDGNVRHQNYTIYIFRRALRIVFPCAERVVADRVTNYTLRVEDDDGNLVDNARVNVSLDNRTVVSGYTRNGYFSFSLSIPEGNHTLHLEVSRYGYKRADLWKKIEAVGGKKENSGSPYFIPIIITIIFLVVVAVFVAYILRKRARKYGEITRERLKNQK